MADDHVLRIQQLSRKHPAALRKRPVDQLIGLRARTAENAELVTERSRNDRITRHDAIEQNVRHASLTLAKILPSVIVGRNAPAVVGLGHLSSEVRQLRDASTAGKR